MTDTEIVDLYWERSEQAIEETRKKYGNLLNYTAENILHSWQDTEECVADTYLAAWNAMPQERPVYLSAFLTRITKNLALKKLEYLTAAKRNRQFEETMEEMESLFSDTNIEKEIELKEITEHLNSFLKTCSNLHRKIFIRRYYYFETINSISKRYHIKKGTIKSILFRMRKQLKQDLKKEGF